MTLGLFCQTYRLGWNSREAPGGVVIARLTPHFLDGKGTGSQTQRIAVGLHA